MEVVLTMDNQQFYDQLMDDVHRNASIENTFTNEAFLGEVADMLVEAEEVGTLTPVFFTGRGTRNRGLAVSAYDMDDSDDSVALAVSHFEDGHKVATLTEGEAKRQFATVQNYIQDALSGAFLDGHEESTEGYYLADQLHRRGQSVTRYRIYLLTNMALSARAKDFPSKVMDGIPVEFHVWDIDRLRRVYESTLGREETVINLTEWAPNGIPALKANGSRETTTTYLCVLPVRLLGDLYGRYGGRLLQSNVRSYLSNRTKINRGIRETVMSKPELFLAYNNGITATATAVQEKDSSIITVTDLQIVNGGQTTASLFYVLRDPKKGVRFDDAHVQAKLVIVSPEEAEDLVPNISRFANSQNKVNEADFFSNSPFHVRLEEISRRVMTPPRAGVTYQTKWFYERTRGQYSNEVAKRGRVEGEKFKAEFPRDQVITKTDAAKYTVSWSREPHKVSAGAQKNFVAFAERTAKIWEESSDSINESYFKDLVAQGILFNSLRARIAKEPWYQSGYLANIVTYTIAKLVDLVAKSGQGRLDLDAVWQRQGISETTMNFALVIALQVRDVLVAGDRPVTNVTEWAKREECWKRVQALGIPLPEKFVSELVLSDHVQSAKKAARVQQQVDNGIKAQTAVLSLSREEWLGIKQFMQTYKLLSPTDASLLDLVTRPIPKLPTERQSVRLLDIRNRSVLNGYEFENS